jgi:hypothetical protein
MTDREDLAVGELIEQLALWFPGDAGAAITALSRAVETIAEGASRYAAERSGEWHEGCDHLFDAVRQIAEERERSVVICALSRLIRARLPHRPVRSHPDPAGPAAAFSPPEKLDEGLQP